MSDTTMTGVPEGVRARIERGEVPPPRVWTDAPDPIRDTRYAIAVAEDKGDMGEVNRLNARWLNLQAEGHTSDWQPKAYNPAEQRMTPSQGELERAARDADEAGDHERAHTLRVKAMHAPNKVDPALNTQIAEAEQAGDWATANRLKGQQLAQLRGDPAPPPPAPAPAPLTVPEMQQAVSQAEAAAKEARRKGDIGEARGHWATANRLNLQILAEARSHQETAVPYSPATTNPDNAA